MPAPPTDRSARSAQPGPERPRELSNPSGKPIDHAIQSLLPLIEQALTEACQFGPGCPERLGDAIRYAVLAPGKRLRPALVLMAAEACGGTLEDGLPGAVAVEMIHAYSLIHDDLPAMDDDDLRRGRPTVHIKYDEATAILAGDALQPLAIAHLCKQVKDPVVAAQTVQVLATAAGPEQLVGGQADDLAAESGQLPDPVRKALESLSEQSSESSRIESQQTAVAFLESIHRRKTGALFAASLQLGAVLCRGTDEQRDALAGYASDVGLAFQVVDDLLDHTADESQLGKRVGKDVGRGKMTYPGLLGIDRARQLADELVESAKSRTAVFGPNASRLNILADYVLARTH